jgi:hypothetical protein
MEKKDKPSFGFCAIIALLVIASAFITAMSVTTSCSNSGKAGVENQTKEAAPYTNRFVVVEREYSMNIVYDKNTLVMYSVTNGIYNSGNMTMLCDSTGKPLLWKGGNDE